jgi:hypothetical protein
MERAFLTCAAFIGGIILVLYLSGLGLERAESDGRSATPRAGGANLGATAASLLSSGLPLGIPGVVPSDATNVVVPRTELT